MSTGTTKSPNLFNAPPEYDPKYQNLLNNALRLYFAQLDNPGFSAASGLLLSLDTLPTDADVATLRPGTVYRDSAAGNALKIKV
jgi:hypothetical protein